MKTFLKLTLLLLSLAEIGFGQASTVDPCPTNTPKSSVVINVSTATTTSLVSVVGGQPVYVCGFLFTAVTGTGATYQLEYGTGAACTSPTVLTGAMIGNGGPLALGLTLKAPASNGVCLVTGGTGPNAQGVLFYIQAAIP